MKPILIALTALTLSVGTAYATPFGSEAEFHSELAAWHGAATTPHYASYTAASYARLWTLARRRGVTLEGALSWSYTFVGQPWFAGYRQLASNGVDLAVLNVFRLFAKLGDEQVAREPDGDLTGVGPGAHAHLVLGGERAGQDAGGVGEAAGVRAHQQHRRPARAGLHQGGHQLVGGAAEHEHDVGRRQQALADHDAGPAQGGEQRGGDGRGAVARDEAHGGHGLDPRRTGAGPPPERPARPPVPCRPRDSRAPPGPALIMQL